GHLSPVGQLGDHFALEFLLEHFACHSIDNLLVSSLNRLRDVVGLHGHRGGGRVVTKYVECDCRVERSGDIGVNKRHLSTVRQLDDNVLLELFASETLRQHVVPPVLWIAAVRCTTTDFHGRRGCSNTQFAKSSAQLVVTEL